MLKNCYKLCVISVTPKKTLNLNRIPIFLQNRQFASIRLNESRGKKITSLGYILLAVPITTFGLGCWQVQRLSWKENLIRELEEKINAAPVKLPADLSELNSMEYRPVKVTGHFIHNKEIYLGPRSYIEKGDGTSGSGLFSKDNKGIGYHVITPFQIEGREEKILVNRGWVSKTHLNPSARQSGQVEGQIELVGVVRVNEKRPQFSPEHKGEHFLYRDLNRMCAMIDADPIFLDARLETTVKGGPIGGQTRVTLRNDHLSYLITWFTLSGFTALMWYKTVLKRTKF